jgi:hypothetical protein
MIILKPPSSVSLAECSLIGAILLAACLPCSAGGRFSATHAEERVDVLLGDELLTSYKVPSDWKFPYLYPMPGPITGKSVTIERGIKHPHHTSVYFACDKVNGGNYWQEGIERGKMVSRGPRILETGDRAVLWDSCDWYHDDAPSPIRDYRRVVVEAPSETIRTIQFQILLEFKVDTHIDPSNHALFSAEIEPPLAVKTGSGRIQNSLGGINEKGTWGVKAPWCSYFAEQEDVVEGIAMLQHPNNPCFPWQFFTRDYGFISPTPMYWLPAEGIDYQAGEEVSLTFLVVIHAGTPIEANIESIYQAWSQTDPGPVPKDPQPESPQDR